MVGPVYVKKVQLTCDHLPLGSHTVLALHDNESHTIWYYTAIVDVKLLHWVI
jgi:hypothetical protein